MNTSALPDKLTNLITQPVLLVAIIVLVAAACITTSYQRLSLPTSQQTASIQSTTHTNSNATLSSAEIIALNLFGAPSSTVQVEKRREDIPETKLKLVLKGAFSHSDQNQASALIASDRGKRAELFTVGDELPGKAILEEVYADYVVLKRGIQLEKLQFSRNIEGSEKSNKSPRYPPGVSNQAATYKTQNSYNESRATPVVVPDKTVAPPSLSPSSNTLKSTADVRAMIRQRQ